MACCGLGKEALKREYHLYRAAAKPYNRSHADQLLALRFEQIIGQEVSKGLIFDQGKTDDGARRDPAYGANAG